MSDPPSPIERFGIFEINLRSGELRKAGVRIRVQEQPLKVLEALLEHPGEIVTREELCERIWPDEAFGDFDHALNIAVAKLRTALGDSAETPRFVETLQRRGYRFIAPVERQLVTAELQGDLKRDAESAKRGTRSEPLVNWQRLWLILLVLAVAIGASVLVKMFYIGAPSRDITSIAVLPLDNLSHDPEQEYFADGMTEELIRELGQITSLRVISRTSAMQYKGMHKKLPQIARELSVDGVIEGTVQRARHSVRVTVQLVDARKDKQLWSRTYDRDLGDVFRLQTDIADDIVGQMQTRLRSEEHNRLPSARKTSPEVYDAYLKGLSEFSFGRDEADPLKSEQLLRRSVQDFLQATRMDPSYAPAYAGLAVSYDWLAGMDFDLDLKAREAATTALQIDPSLGEAHYVLGWVAFIFDWDWTTAEKELRKAIQLSPSFGEAHHAYALFLNAMGRHDEAIVEIGKALELDPAVRIQKGRAGWIYACAGKYDQAIDLLRDALEVTPDDPRLHAVLGDVYLHKGMRADAAVERRKAAKLMGDTREARIELAAADAASGNEDESRTILNGLEKMPRRGLDWPVEVARIYSAIGERDQAIDWLEKAYANHSYGLLDLRCLRELDVLKSDRRFQNLVRRINFPD